jgi:transposase InsO family protein
MPWKECSLMASRLEFVLLASAPGANMSALCRSYGVSRKTGHKWLCLFKEQGKDGLQDRSRRPHSSPRRSDAGLEGRIVALHDTYPYWGGRKLQALLPESSEKPHHKTVSAILRRHDRQVLSSTKAGPPATKRFEHEAPNLLWQMDFKGHFAMTDARAHRCYPLTVLDDHSRFAICLAACAGETGDEVRQALISAFKTYGLPERITCDNGNPWGTPKQNGLTRFEVWLLRLGIQVSHSRPMHPQTQGKDERFHRTLKLELLNHRGFSSLAVCQDAFDKWRDQYNLIRPHFALDQQPPISRYAASGRAYPTQLPPIEYAVEDAVRKVRGNGHISFKSHQLFVGEGLTGEYVAVRPVDHDGIFQVLFCNRKLGEIDLRTHGKMA